MDDPNRENATDSEWLSYILNISIFLVVVLGLYLLYISGPVLLRRSIRKLVVAPKLDKVYRETHLEEDSVSEDEHVEQTWTGPMTVDSIELPDWRPTD